jgi:hypothetical protein
MGFQPILEMRIGIWVIVNDIEVLFTRMFGKALRLIWLVEGLSLFILEWDGGELDTLLLGMRFLLNIA